MCSGSGCQRAMQKLSRIRPRRRVRAAFTPRLHSHPHSAGVAASRRRRDAIHSDGMHHDASRGPRRRRAHVASRLHGGARATNCRQARLAASTADACFAECLRQPLCDSATFYGAAWPEPLRSSCFGRTAGGTAVLRRVRGDVQAAWKHCASPCKLQQALDEHCRRLAASGSCPPSVAIARNIRLMQNSSAQEDFQFVCFDALTASGDAPLQLACVDDRGHAQPCAAPRLARGRQGTARRILTWAIGRRPPASAPRRRSRGAEALATVALHDLHRGKCGAPACLASEGGGLRRSEPAVPPPPPPPPPPPGAWRAQPMWRSASTRCAASVRLRLLGDARRESGAAHARRGPSVGSGGRGIRTRFMPSAATAPAAAENADPTAAALLSWWLRPGDTGGPTPTLSVRHASSAPCSRSPARTTVVLGPAAAAEFDRWCLSVTRRRASRRRRSACLLVAGAAALGDGLKTRMVANRHSGGVGHSLRCRAMLRAAAASRWCTIVSTSSAARCRSGGRTS